jgi:hypothetical protein
MPAAAVEVMRFASCGDGRPVLPAVVVISPPMGARFVTLSSCVVIDGQGDARALAGPSKEGDRLGGGGGKVL